MDKENYNEMKQSLTEFKKQITSKHETIKSLTDQVQNLEAQRQEWEHLKESFKKSSHAWQMMKSEIEKKEVELLRDGALLQHYKDEFEKLKEIAELLFTRENHLHTKLDHVFQSSRKNQHVLENIIQMVTSTIDDLFLPQNSQNFSKNVLALTQFNNKVHHMINNVVKKLEEESGRNDTNPENKICDSQNKNILTELYESSEFFSSEFQKFQEKCSSKILEIHEFIEKSDRYVSECKNAYHMVNICKILMVDFNVQFPYGSFCSHNEQIHKRYSFRSFSSLKLNEVFIFSSKISCSIFNLCRISLKFTKFSGRK